ncbi:helix-turn-helix domain-containing protein [Streptomyces sp. NPDC093707]|uniref:helix-turn-helix domain-containing protein n=1 Tax=Streptomyces sp. NPDC093707 TaxID=3154984 RepID=UPI00344B8B78
MEQAAELRELVGSRDVPADIAARGRIVLWAAEGRRRKDIAELLGVSLPTVDRWKRRYAEHGLAGLEGDRPGGAREQVPARTMASTTASEPSIGVGITTPTTVRCAAPPGSSDGSGFAITIRKTSHPGAPSIR